MICRCGHHYDTHHRGTGSCLYWRPGVWTCPCLKVRRIRWWARIIASVLYNARKVPDRIRGRKRFAAYDSGGTFIPGAFVTGYVDRKGNTHIDKIKHI